jgi:2-polyprenyl-6-methoxyphenol hydroxylase-like FAD-dependent oxidoreductase
MTGAGEQQVTIVGAGPTGLTCAILLRTRGVDCRIFDLAPATTAQTRAIGLTARSLEVLDGFGAAEELVERGLPNRAANFYAGSRRVARMTSAKTRGTRYPFILAVPQSITEEVLERHLDALGGTVERGTELLGVAADETGVTLRERADGVEREGRSGWVVGADGSHSVVRHSLDIAFEGSATGRTFANVDALLDPGPPAGEGHYHFSPAGLLVIAPLPDGHFRITAQVDSAAGSPLDVAGVQALIDARTGAPWRVRRLGDAGWGIATIPVQARIAARFSRGRCLLAGDAAHVFGPTGAQGMNTGIQDAHNLAWKLGLVVERQAGEALIDSYGIERRGVAEEVLQAVEMQTKMATVRSRPGRAARDLALRGLSGLGVLDSKLAPRISQLDIDYPDTAWTRAFDRSAPAGARCPDVAVGEGGRTLFDLLRAGSFNLVELTEEGHPPQEETIAGVTLGVLAVARREALPGPGPRDRDGSLADFLGGSGGRAALLRPDGHVAAAGSLTDRERLLAHLVGGQLCGTGAASTAGRSSSRT